VLGQTGDVAAGVRKTLDDSLATGSNAFTITMGMLVLARLAAATAASVDMTITSTSSLTIP
jgi:hypothetical protein